MMKISDLRAGYGRVEVLHGISLEIAAGECVGVLGHNGMGKSTLLKTIMGLLPAKGGHIELDGRSIEHDPVHKRARLGIGYVPQGRQIFTNLTVEENLRFAAVARPGLGDTALARVMDDFPELLTLLRRSGGVLSGGEQQLLALARALCGQPKLLLLDEPTEGIQPSLVEAIGVRIEQQRRRRNLTVLLVEQNLEFIRRVADRVLLIHRGRIAREIEPDALAEPELVGEFIGVGSAPGGPSSIATG